jgi:hypothetical protein
MKNIYSISLISFLFFTSCEFTKEIDFNGTIAASKIVIEANLNSDFGVKATIMKSVPITKTTESTYLESPGVWLYKNNQPYTQLHETDSSKYETNDTILLTKETEYKLVVNAEGYDTAISNSEKLMDKVMIDNIYRVYDTINWIGFIYVKFNDTTPDTDTEYNIIITPYLDGNSSPSSTISGTLFDSGFNTVEKTYYGNYKGHLDSAIVKIYSFSRINIEFSQSYSDYEGSYSDSYYDNVFSVKNYIKNGYGYLGAYEVSSKKYVREIN